MATSKARRQASVLRALELNAANVVIACDLAKMPRSTYYKWLLTDEQFAAEVERVQISTGAMIDAEIDRRGRIGVVEDVWHDGEKVGKVRKFSDSLLIARAKAHLTLRNAYRDRTSIEHSGNIGGRESDEVEKLLTEIETNVKAKSLRTNDTQVK